jgi:hypothetical protein
VTRVAITTPHRSFAPALGLLLLLGAALALPACAMPAADARVQEKVPDRASFAEVAQVLEHHCGTLDCHGSAQRNLRIYGNESLRLNAKDRPLMPACTTAAEVEEDYQSTVGLEPELMTAVVESGGADPQRLTLIRKARGSEHHKGGSPIHEGDDADQCLTSWLASRTDTAACLRAIPKSTCF